MDQQPGVLRKGHRSLTDHEGININQWRRLSMASAAHEDSDERGVISRTYSSLSLFYRSLLHHLAKPPGQVPEPVRRRLESGYISLLTWADDYGVEKGNVDSLLESSQSLKTLTIRIMTDICRSLATGLPPTYLISCPPFSST